MVVFHREDFLTDKIENYDIIRLKGGNLSDKIGEPQLPSKLIHIYLPPDSKMDSFNFTRKEETLQENFLIYPAQPPRVLSKEVTEFVEPKETIYNSALPYPEDIVEYRGTNNLGGHQIASFLIHPLQYVPSKKTVILNREVKVKIFTSHKTSIFSKKHFRKSFDTTVKNFVKNPEYVPLRMPFNNEYDYVIITSSELDTIFDRLGAWKTKKGIRAKVVTTDSIYANYSGVDNAEKLRYFIIDAYQNWGISWVLLGGDTEIVPHRVVYAMDCQQNSGNDLPCDLYYSDLDGNWNADGDTIFGEVADSVDMFPDVFVGRAPVENLIEAQTFVDKVLTYEKNPPTDYQTKLLFLAEILWWDIYTDQGIAKDMIDDLSVPERFYIKKLYERDGNEYRATVLDALNEGYSIVNHDGHAHKDRMGIGGEEGSDYLYISDVDSLTNGSKYSILYSIGCWPAAFDYDCIAEHFLNNPLGGGVAFIGNSRYGWGSPGNPGYGYSDRFDFEFFNQVFNFDIHHLGEATAFAKASFVPYSQDSNVYRWCEYELNLLGDPELPIWTDIPENLLVQHPETIPVGENLVNITVSKNSQPVYDGLVCIMNDEVYVADYTDNSGQVSFHISPASPGSLSVTVTAKNCIPYEENIKIVSETPYLYVKGFGVDDRFGNSNGEINPGEKLVLRILLENGGGNPSGNVIGILRTEDKYITIVDSIKGFGDITDTSFADYRFIVSSDCPNGHISHFSFDINDGVGRVWDEVIGIEVVSPIIVYSGYSIVDSLGNNNGIAEPGEMVYLNVNLKNSGSGKAMNVRAKLCATDSFVSIKNEAIYGDIGVGSIKTQSFLIEIDSTLSHPLYSNMMLDVSGSEGQHFYESFLFTIGETGFFDDMENGADNWSSDVYWHLITKRAYSGSSSWYCGNTVSYTYYNNCKQSLYTKPVFLPQNSYLSFWHWFDVAIYGVNGIYVEVFDGDEWVRLDFIGSGGALPDSFLMGNDWTEVSYDLSSFFPCDSFMVRFRFVSDWEPAKEGFYIDDVSIESVEPEFSGLKPINLTADGTNPSLWTNNPSFILNWLNPVNGISKVYCKLNSYPNSSYDTTQTLSPTPPCSINVKTEGKNVLYLWFKDKDGNVRYWENSFVYLRYDSTPPESSICSSPDTVYDCNFVVNWTAGKDTLSGVAGYNIRVKEEGGEWEDWLKNHTKQSAVFNGEPKKKYYFEAGAVDSAGNVEPFTGNSECETFVVGIIPVVRSFYVKAFPNPFTSFTVIRYSLPNNRDPITDDQSNGSCGHVVLKIYDSVGRLVRTFPITDHRSPITEVVWNGKDTYGNRVSSGVYFYRLEAHTGASRGDFTSIKKMVFIKQ